MNFNTLIVATLLLFVSISACQSKTPVSNDAVNAELLGRFESEAPKAWQSARESYQNFIRKTGWDAEVVIKVGEEVTHHSQASNLGHGYVVLKGGVETKAKEETIAVFNKSYFAMLQRTKGRNEWLLKNLGPIPEFSTEKSLSEALNEVVVSLFYAANQLETAIHPFGQNPLLEHSREDAKGWFDLRDRKILGIDYIDYDGNEMVKTTMSSSVKVIDWSNPNPNGSYNAVDKTWKYEAVFDPANHWCLREVTGGGMNGKGVKLDLKKTYDYSKVQHVQVCVRRFATHNNSTKAEDEKFGMEHSCNLAKADLLPTDFTLSAYGLPEPDWYQPPIPWWLYSSLIGAVLIVCGAVILRFGKKLSR